MYDLVHAYKTEEDRWEMVLLYPNLAILHVYSNGEFEMNSFLLFYCCTIIRQGRIGFLAHRERFWLSRPLAQKSDLPGAPPHTMICDLNWRL